MSDINRINVTSLKNYKNIFASDESKFNGVSYSTYNSSYLKQCSDPCISNMSNNLNTLYENIRKGYSNINKWWSDYNNDVESLENCLSGNGVAGNILESSVRNYVIANLSNLHDYKYQKSNTFSLEANVIGDSFLSLLYENPISEHLNNIKQASLQNVQMLLYEIIEYCDNFSKKPLDKDNLLQFGSTVMDSMTNLLEEFWTVDAACSLVVGTSSVLFGGGKFVTGRSSDVGPVEIFFLDDEAEEQYIFLKAIKLQEKIKEEPNYNLTENEYKLLINYYYKKNVEINDNDLDTLIRYFENKLENNVPEYDEILIILDEMKTSELTIEMQQAKINRIFRLSNQADTVSKKYDFYNETDLGRFINSNSLFEFDSKVSTGIEDKTEQTLIYGTHISTNFISGFVGGVIPFADLLFKPAEYKEGLYFSDELGKEKLEALAEEAYMIGTMVGLVTDIGISQAISGLSLATKATKVASAVDDVTDVTKTVDKLSDAVKVADKANDVVKSSNKIKKTAEEILDFLTGGFYKSIKSSVVKRSMNDVAEEALDQLTGGIYRNAKSLISYYKLSNSVDDVTDVAKVVDNASDASKVVNGINGAIDTDEYYKFKISDPSLTKEQRENFERIYNNAIRVKKNIAIQLEAIFDCDNYIIGVHKTPVSGEVILNEGLRLSGDLSSGVVADIPSIYKNIAFEAYKYKDFTSFCNELASSANYKEASWQGKGTGIIIKIPKADINNINKITYFNGIQHVLKTDYIAGYVNVIKNESGGTIQELIYNKNYKLSDTLANINSSVNKTNNRSIESLNKFKLVFSDGKSDEQLLDIIYQKYSKLIKGNNEEALKMINKLTQLKQKNPELKFKIGTPTTELSTSYYLPLDKAIYIMPQDLYSVPGRFEKVIVHELGHMIDYNSGFSSYPNYKKIFANAKNNLTSNNNKLLEEFKQKYITNSYTIARSDANKLLSKNINELGFDNFKDYRDNLIKQYDEILNGSSSDAVIEYIKKLKIDDYIYPGKIDASVLADADIAATFNNLTRNLNNRYSSGIGSVSDMIDAVFLGNFKDTSGFPGHGSKYYRNQNNFDIVESIAQFFSLKVVAPERLDDVKYFLGEEFYNLLDTLYNERLN